jgi:uncharacterized protein YbjT (DUF2867 family)
LRLLILGASGGIGSWLTSLAAERGHEVTALVRPAADFAPPASVNVVRGDVSEPSVFDTVVPGQDAVLSALGLRRAGRSPSAPLLSPSDLTQRVARQIVEPMRRHGVRRMIVVSAGGVADSFSQLTFPVKRLVSSGNIAVAYRDLAAMEEQLATSGLDWLAVRPVTLTNGRPTGRARAVVKYSLFSTVRRSDVAAWMLRQIERDGPFPARTVMLGT